MSKKLLWNTEKRIVRDLKDHPNNPRSLSKKSHADLLKSFEQFDYVELVAIDFDNTIVAGHQRIHMMLEMGWQDKEIDVRVPNRKLTKQEQKKYLLVSNKVTGDFDYDILANQFDMEELFDAGFVEEDFLGKIATDAEESEEEEEQGLDEQIEQALDSLVKFVIVASNEDSTSLQNQLDKVLKGFPRVKMEIKT